MSEEIGDSKKDNKIDDNTSLKDLIYKADLTAIVVVGLAVALLLIVTGVMILRNTENNAPKAITISYTFRVDSNYLKTIRDSTSFEYSKYIQQNNEKLLKEINNSIDHQYKRMESILDVQEDKGKLFTYGGSFLAILVALATFFGFKSINEMKKGTIDAAEYEAKKVASDIAEEKTKEKVQQLLDDIRKQITLEVKADFKGEFERKELIISEEFRNELMQVLNRSLENFEERILELESKDRNTNPRDEAGDGNNSIEHLENVVNKTEMDVNKQEDDSSHGDLFADNNNENNK